VLGASGSGKSALVRRYVDDTFTKQRRTAPRSVRELLVPVDSLSTSSVRVSIHVVPDVDADMREALANTDVAVLAVDPHDAYWSAPLERCCQALQRALETREGPYVGRSMKTYTRPLLVALTKCDVRDQHSEPTAEERDATAVLRARLMHIVVPVVGANDEPALRQPQIMLCSSALSLGAPGSNVAELFAAAVTLALDGKRWRRKHADAYHSARPASPSERTTGQTAAHRLRAASALGRQWRADSSGGAADALHAVESDSIHTLYTAGQRPLPMGSLSASALDVGKGVSAAVTQPLPAQRLSRHSTGHTELEDTLVPSAVSGSTLDDSDEQCQIT
jgi:GTPase SAR1 family protein